MNGTETNIRVRDSVRVGVIREQQKKERFTAAMKADFQIGDQLAVACRGVNAADLVEALHFKDTGNVFYQFKTRPYGQTVILAKTYESTEQVLRHNKIEMDYLPRMPEARGFCSPNRLRKYLPAKSPEVTVQALLIANPQL